MAEQSTTSAAAARVSTPAGEVIGIPGGKRLVFGRGPDADLTLDAGRGLSRRAGLIAAVPGGVWVANISCTHALYAVSDGSRTMLDEGQSLRVAVGDGPVERLVGDGSVRARARPDEDATLLPLYLDPKTKLFLVALMWCRPWLADPSRTTPLPRTPEIARAALDVTDAHHELERFARGMEL